MARLQFHMVVLGHIHRDPQPLSICLRRAQHRRAGRLAKPLRQHLRSIQHPAILGQILAPSRSTQLLHLRISDLAEDTEVTSRFLRRSNLRQLRSLSDLGHRARMHHGTAWFHMRVLGGHCVFHDVSCRLVSRSERAASCIPRFWKKSAGRVDLQAGGVCMGVWVLVLGVTEAPVSQGSVYAGLNERETKGMGGRIAGKEARINQI